MQENTRRSRILVTTILALVAWLTIGQGIALLFAGRLSAYLVANTPFLILGLTLFLSIRFIIGIPIGELASDAQPLRKKLILHSFFLYTALSALFLTITSVIWPASIAYNPAPLAKRILFILTALIFTPIQTTSEEFLFRILPTRLVQPKRLSQRWPLALFSGLLFALPHLGNREVAAAEAPWVVLLYYGLFGCVLTAISLYSGGFEIALGAHAANNLFVAIVCNYPASSLPSPSLFLSLRTPGTLQDLAQLCILLFAMGLLGISWKKKFAPSLSPAE